MKKRINLLIKKKKSSISPLVTERINFYSSLIGVFIFVIFLFFIFLQYQVHAEKSKLLKEKEDLYSFILANKDDIAKMNLYTKKNAQLKTYLKDDAEFLPYYNLLKDALSRADDTNPDPVLDIMEIDKTRHTEFTVQFKEYQPAYAFLKVMESPIFLDNFEELKLIGFSLNTQKNAIDQTGGYELQFEGKFKPIDGENN